MLPLDLATGSATSGWATRGVFYPGWSRVYDLGLALVVGLGVFVVGSWWLVTGRSGSSLAGIGFPLAAATATPMIVLPLIGSGSPVSIAVGSLLAVASMVPLALALAARVEEPLDRRFAWLAIGLCSSAAAAVSLGYVLDVAHRDLLGGLWIALTGAIPLVPGSLPPDRSNSRSSGRVVGRAVCSAPPSWPLPVRRRCSPCSPEVSSPIWPLAAWLIGIALAGRFTVRPLARLATRATLQRDLVVAATGGRACAARRRHPRRRAPGADPAGSPARGVRRHGGRRDRADRRRPAAGDLRRPAPADPRRPRRRAGPRLARPPDRAARRRRGPPRARRRRPARRRRRAGDLPRRPGGARERRQARPAADRRPLPVDRRRDLAVDRRRGARHRRRRAGRRRADGPLRAPEHGPAGRADRGDPRRPALAERRDPRRPRVAAALTDGSAPTDPAPRSWTTTPSFGKGRRPCSRRSPASRSPARPARSTRREPLIERCRRTCCSSTSAWDRIPACAS